MNKTNYMDSLKIGNGTRISMLFILVSLSISSPFAQYQIKKYSINSSGTQNMSAGDYQISSSIAQVDASNSMNGGSFSITGGFWQPLSITNNEIIFANSFE